MLSRLCRIFAEESPHHPSVDVLEKVFKENVGKLPEKEPAILPPEKKRMRTMVGKIERHRGGASVHPDWEGWVNDCVPANSSGNLEPRARGVVGLSRKFPAATESPDANEEPSPKRPRTIETIGAPALDAEEFPT